MEDLDSSMHGIYRVSISLTVPSYTVAYCEYFKLLLYLIPMRRNRNSEINEDIEILILRQVNGRLVF